MAKANRKDLISLARELGLNNLDHNALMKLIDTAQGEADPAEFLRGFNNGRRGVSPLPDDGQAAADRIVEVLAAGATDPALLAPVPAADFVLDGNRYIPLPNLAAVPDVPNGHQTRKVEMQLTGFPLARRALTKLRHHLDATNARCTKGKHVESASRALIWLLEQYGRACGLETRGLDPQDPSPQPQDPNAEETPRETA